MADLRGFNANQVEPYAIDCVPAGTYVAVITESEMKPNRRGTGHYLELKFQIIEGPYRGRYLWTRLNLDHPNATVVQLARAELSSVCRAVGVLAPSDSAELHNLPLMIRVRCETRPDNGATINRITGYSKRQASQALPAQPNNTPWR